MCEAVFVSYSFAKANASDHGDAICLTRTRVCLDIRSYMQERSQIASSRLRRAWIA